MIDRYTRPEMAAIWSLENKYRLWLDIEIAVCEAQAQLGVVPTEAVEVIKQKACFKTERIEEIEREIHHDVIAFLTNVAEYVGEESRYIHLGMTSADIVDTALSLQMRQAGEIILKDLTRLKDISSKLAIEHKDTVMIGRTHGIHAEPMTFGLKMALWYEETKRNISRLERAIENISVGKISGAIGTYAHLDPFVEEYVCQKLGLKPELVSTQIIQRDHHAEYMATLAVVASSLEKFATEIRNLQRTEVLEVEEPFSKGQKGSSAMPHKRNPEKCERVAGLARVIRSNALAELESVALWHERDLTNSSVERVIIPDSTILLDYILNLFCGVLEGLNVYPQNMERNLWKTKGLVFSQRVLLKLTQKGLSREVSYKIVQDCAMESWHTEADFRELLSNDPQVKEYLSSEELASCFDLSEPLKNIDFVFKRLGLIQ